MIIIMKRRLISGLMLVFMLFAVSTSGFAAAAAGENDVREKLRNEGVWLTPEESLQQKAELDSLLDSLDKAANMLEKLKAPQLQVQLNGSKVEAPPYMSIINGQVMVPLRWSADVLGAASVEWDAAARTVTITTPQDFYNIEKFRSYAGALQPPIDVPNDKIWPLPEKVKDMQIPDLVSDRHWVLNLNQFDPEREGLTLPAPRDHITVNIISIDGVYQHSSVVNSIENHQGHYYLPMDWLEYLFNARVSYNEASKMLSIHTSDLEQIKSEIERIENALIPDSADEAVKLWGRGMQTRNGALQYAALSPKLRQEADKSAYVRQSYWVTGCSSPQVGPITIESRNELSDTKIEYTITFPEIFSGQTHAIATEKMVVEKLPANGREGWFITQILQTSGYGIIDSDASLGAEIIGQDEALRNEYFEFAIENRLDYVPLFEEGEAPAQSEEYLYYAFIINLDNWGDDKGIMTKDYVEQVIQTHFEVDSVTHGPLERGWDYDGEEYIAHPMGVNEEPIYVLQTYDTYTKDQRTIFEITMDQCSFGGVIPAPEDMHNIKKSIASGDLSALTTLQTERFKYYIDPATHAVVFLSHTLTTPV